jgi:hypothetical protein
MPKWSYLVWTKSVKLERVAVACIPEWNERCKDKWKQNLATQVVFKPTPLNANAWDQCDVSNVQSVP